MDDVYYPRVYVSQVRHKIEPDPANPIYIMTEHRVGYRFEKQMPGAFAKRENLDPPRSL